MIALDSDGRLRRPLGLSVLVGGEIIRRALGSLAVAGLAAPALA